MAKLTPLQAHNFTAELNELCARHGVQLAGGQCEWEGVIVIECTTADGPLEHYLDRNGDYYLRARLPHD